MDFPDFSNFLNDRARERGFDLKRLSGLTGVSIKHLESLFSGDSDRLPPAPYLKGYIFKLGEVLDFNSEEIWEMMKKIAVSKNSVNADEPVKNRFSRKPIGKYLIVGAVIALLLLYAGLRFYEISGTPIITISSPQANISVVGENSFSLFGSISNGGELKVNGEPVQVQSDGNWQKIVSLQEGINTVEITAKKFLGRETRIIRQIIYQPPASPKQ